MPFSRYDSSGALMGEYQQQNVSVIVQLVSDEEAFEKTGKKLRTLYPEAGFECIYLPIPDFNVPDKDALEAAISLALQRAKAGQNIAVHCNAGIGRTGLFLACLARRVLDLSANEAISWVRQFIPGAVEVPEQMRLVEEYAHY
jgi:protein-tyrosine phosphatase